MRIRPDILNETFDKYISEANSIYKRMDMELEKISQKNFEKYSDCSEKYQKLIEVIVRNLQSLKHNK